MEDIYAPKAAFLFDGLRADGFPVTDATFADFGAGAGYFVAALHKMGSRHAVAYEVSSREIALARQMVPDIVIHQRLG